MPIETLLENFKLGVLENDEFEYRENNNDNFTVRHFRPIMKILLLEQKSKNFISNTTDTKLLINTLIEEVKPTVMEKYEFCYRVESTLMSILAFLDYRYSGARIKIRDISVE